VRVEPNAIGMTMGIVSFGGITKEVCLAYTPDVAPGDYVLVHVGFAISTLDEGHAKEVFETLRRMGELGDLGDVDDLAAAAGGSWGPPS